MVSPLHGSGSPRKESASGSQRKGRRSSPGTGPGSNPGIGPSSNPGEIPGAPPADPLLDTVLSDRYLMLERLSQGGMGVVYKARHILLDQHVAVKILLEQRDKTAQLRFLQEAKLASKVHHPNTVYISDFGVLPDGRLYLVMELLRGPTLSREIAKGRIEPLRACQIALQMVTGLDAIHAAGIIHRDLKPDNIFLVEQPVKDTQNGAHELVKIVDFGIALTAGAQLPTEPVPVPTRPPPEGDTGRLTVAGMVMGTPVYMSPEQIEGTPLDARSDQYALGCILYEMLTGTVPFDGAAGHIIMLKHLRAEPDLPEVRCPEAHISRPLSSLVLRLIAKDRESRFPSLSDVAKELQTEIARLQLKGGQRVLVTKSAADMFGRGRRRLTMLALPSVMLLLGGGYLAQRYLAPRPVIEQAGLRPGEALAARRSALTLLQSAAADPEPKVRYAVVAALGQTRDPGQRQLIESQLRDVRPEIVAQAATSLALLGDRAAVAPLKALLERTPPGTLRVAVAASLEQLAEQSGALALRQALDSGDDQSRLKAALLLADRGEPRARALLSAAVKNPRLPEEAAVTLLARLTQTGDADARSQLVQRMNTSGRREVQLLAAAKLAQLGDEQGRAFLRTLAQRRGPEQLPAARFLASPDESVGLDALRSVAFDRQATLGERTLAIEGLGQAGRVLDVRKLQPLLAPAEPAELQRAAAIAILQLTAGEPGTLSEQSIGWARLAVNDSDWVVRESAALVLGDSASAQAGELLSALAQDKDAMVRRAAVRALARRTELSALNDLKTRIADSDAGVRVETLRALTQLAQTLLKRSPREFIAELLTVVKARVERGTPEEQLLGRVVLLRLGDATQREALRSWLSSTDLEMRRLLIENTSNDIELLRGALNDENLELRMLAARRLAALHDSRALPVLHQGIEQGGLLALQAYAALRQLGENVNAPKEVRGDQSTVEQRIQIVEALLDLPAAEALPGLRRAARDSDPRVRQRVAEVAAALPVTSDGPQGEPILKLLLDDADMAVRARAAALLSRLLKATSEPTPAAQEPAARPAATPKVEAPAAPATPPTEAAAVEPTPPAEPGTAPPPVETKGDEAVKQLAQSGVRSLTSKDFTKAQQLLEKADRLCSREHRSSAACTEVSFDIAYHLGRAHEEQRHLAQAMAEYEKAIKLSSRSRAKPELLAEAQDGIVRLVPRLGVLIVPKKGRGGCQEVSIWMEPGQHEIQVNGQRTSVEVRAHEKQKVGSCSASEQ